MSTTLKQQLKTLGLIPLDNTVLRIMQVCEEDRQSALGIYERIQKDIEGSELTNIFIACSKAVDLYRKDIYYTSKNQRLIEISAISTEDIVNELFIAIMPHNTITPIQVIATKLGNFFNYANVFDGIKTAAEIIGACADTNLFDIWTDPIELKCNYSLDDSTWEFIEKCKYVNPMICKPNSWVDNCHGGYISLKRSVLLNNKHHCKKQCLDAINILQTIQWELDENILALPEEDIKAITKDQKEADTLLIKNSKVTYKEMKNKSFYFEWREDYRGRMYASGYYINFMGNDYKRASLSFTKKQLIK